jgi:hypothetical protein
MICPAGSAEYTAALIKIVTEVTIKPIVDNSVFMTASTWLKGLAP